MKFAHRETVNYIVALEPTPAALLMLLNSSFFLQPWRLVVSPAISISVTDYRERSEARLSANFHLSGRISTCIYSISAVYGQRWYLSERVFRQTLLAVKISAAASISLSHDYARVAYGFFFFFVSSLIACDLFRSWQYTHIRPCPRHYGSSFGANLTIYWYS